MVAAAQVPGFWLPLKVYRWKQGYWEKVWKR